jgi:hypothetical protein
MKQNASPAIIGVVIVALVALLAFIGYKTLGPKSKPSFAPNQAYEDHLKGGKYPQPEKPSGATQGSPSH